MSILPSCKAAPGEAKKADQPMFPRDLGNTDDYFFKHIFHTEYPLICEIWFENIHVCTYMCVHIKAHTYFLYNFEVYPQYN